MADGHKLAMALRAAYLSMHRQADAALQPFGVTANQFVILSVLAEEDGITQRALVDRTSSDANTIRPILAALEKKHFVMRDAHPDDGRAWCVKLTRSGRSAFDEMRTGSETFRNQLTAPLSKTESRNLIEMLDRLVGVMNQSRR